MQKISWFELLPFTLRRRVNYNVQTVDCREFLTRFSSETFEQRVWTLLKWQSNILCLNLCLVRIIFGHANIRKLHHCQTLGTDTWSNIPHQPGTFYYHISLRGETFLPAHRRFYILNIPFYGSNFCQTTLFRTPTMLIVLLAHVHCNDRCMLFRSTHVRSFVYVMNIGTSSPLTNGYRCKTEALAKINFCWSLLLSLQHTLVRFISVYPCNCWRNYCAARVSTLKYWSSVHMPEE